MRPRIIPSITLVTLLLTGASSRALAHAPPLGTGLWWIPSESSASSDRLVIRTPRGFLFQAQGSSELRFLCNEAVGIQDGEEPSFAVADGKALLMTTFGLGLLRGSTNACRWNQVTTVATTPAFDVTTTEPGAGASADATQFAVGGPPNQGEHFWGGRDGGTMWSALANSDMPFTRVRIAPSRPSRIYLTGMALGATGTLVHRLGVSDDAGRTIVDQLIALGPTDLQARVLGVDPLRPDHLYLRVESTSVDVPERLLVSEDGGRSLTTAATLHELRGFAQSDDGQSVWVGGTEGLYRSLDGGGSFSGPTNGAIKKITCLAFHENRLYACGVLDNQLVVAVSDDAGESFQKFFSFEQVTQSVDCPQDDPASSPAVRCADSLAHWRSEFAAVTPPPPPPPTTGTGGASDTRSGGCSVAADDRRRGSAASLMALLLPLALGGRRRRRP